MKPQTQPIPAIEDLEGRRHFAVTVPNLEGDFSGVINLRGVSVLPAAQRVRTTLKVDVADQTSNRVRGTVDAGALGDFNFTGQVGAKRFTLVLRGVGQSLTVKGVVGRNDDVLTGQVINKTGGQTLRAAFRVGRVGEVTITPNTPVNSNRNEDNDIPPTEPGDLFGNVPPAGPGGLIGNGGLFGNNGGSIFNGGLASGGAGLGSSAGSLFGGGGGGFAF